MSADNPNTPDTPRNDASTWDDPRITAYLMGELPDEARVLFEQEIQSSPELAAAVDEGRTVIGELKGFYNASSDATNGLDESRRAVIFGAQAVDPPLGGGWSSKHWMGLAVAASLVFVLAGMMWPAVQSAREASDSRLMSRADNADGFESSIAEAEMDEMASEDGFGRSYSSPAPFSAAPKNAGKPVATSGRARNAGRSLSVSAPKNESGMSLDEVIANTPALHLSIPDAAASPTANGKTSQAFGGSMGMDSMGGMGLRGRPWRRHVWGRGYFRWRHVWRLRNGHVR